MNSKEQQMQAILDAAVARGDFVGLSALYLKDGKTAAYAQAGLADRERGIPFARDAICRVFSMSKPITSFAVMKLWEQGKLDLAAPVSRYLPEYADRYPDLTLDHLMTMTSGFGYDDPNGSDNEKQLCGMFARISDSFTAGGEHSTREVAAEMAALPPMFAPGARWHYGVSADILGAVVEAASGMTFRDYLKQELLDPLGMADTDFYVPAEKRGRLAQVYKYTPGAAEPDPENHLGVPMAMDHLPGFCSGGAGLASTLDDYARFATMLLRGGELDGVRVMDPATVQAMQTPQLTEEVRVGFAQTDPQRAGLNYGHLMRVCTVPEEGEMPLHLGEYGWNGWLGTMFANDPQENATLLIMMQANGHSEENFTLRKQLRGLFW